MYTRRRVSSRRSRPSLGRRKKGSSRGRYKKKRQTFRRVQQRRKAPSARPRLKRMIKDAAATKKQDTMLMATDAGPSLGPITFSQQQRLYLWSPTYRERLNSTEQSSRNTTRVYFRGVKERWDVRVDTAGWVHRRVVFWAFLTPAEGVPFFQGTAANDNLTYFRPFRPIDPTASTGLLEYLWKGTAGTDYQAATRYNAKMDNRRLKIVSDKSRTMNCGNDTTNLNQYTMWTEINKSVVYDEEEAGGQSVTSPWSVVGPNSPGNLFFLDIFYTQPLAAGGASLTFNNQATVYWHEGGSI